MPPWLRGRRAVWAAAVAAIAAGAAAAAWLLTRQGGETAASLLRYAPPGSTIVVCLDLGRLRRSELYRQMKEKLAPAEERLVGDMRGLRLKIEDVEAALVAGSPDSGVVALRMARPMGLDEVLEAPEQRKREEVEGYPVAAPRAKREPWVARVADRVFCLSEREDLLRGVLQRARAGERPRVDAELEGLLEPLRGQEHFLAVSGLAGSLGKAELLLPPPVVSELAGIRAVGVGFSVGSCIDVEARVRLAHADQAMRLCGELQKGIREGIAKIESARPSLQGEQRDAAERGLALLKGIAASQADTLACLKARLDEGATSALVAPLVAGVARARGQAQLTANLANLHQIGLACLSYELQNAKWPKGLAELVEAGLLADRAMLVSPLDKEPPLLAPGVPCSYGTSLGRLSGRAEKVAHLPLAWDRVEFVPGKRGVLFFDGHVETLPGARFAALMQQVELAGAGKERPTPPLPKRPEPLLPRPKPPKQADTELIGGPRGGPFRLTSPTAEPMLGLRCTTRRWMREECLATLEPLFAAAPADPMTVAAKPGYAVGGAEVDAASFVNAVRVVFMRLEGGKLNAADSYRSEWLGKPTGRPPGLLDGKGARVVGVCGRRTLVVNAVGLVIEAGAEP